MSSSMKNHSRQNFSHELYYFSTRRREEEKKCKFSSKYYYEYKIDDGIMEEMI